MGDFWPMNQIADSAALEEPLLRGVSLMSSSDVALRYPEIHHAGWLAVDLPIPGPAERGRLASILDDAVESALTKRGCVPSGLAGGQDLDSTLSDQLYRARLSGLEGLCVIVPPLHGMTNGAGVLDAEDSAALRWWCGATSTRPLMIWLDDANRYLGIYGPPVPLHRLLSFNSDHTPDEHPHPLDRGGRAIARSRDSGISCDATTGTVIRPEKAVAGTEPGVGATDADQTNPGPPSAEGSEESFSPPNASGLGVNPQGEPGELGGTSGCAEADPVVVPAPNPDGDSPQRAGDLAQRPVLAMAPAAAGLDREVDPSAAESDRRVSPNDELTLPLRAVGRSDRRGEPLAMFPRAAQEWPAWARELEAARGPKPLSVVERLFTNAYCPLEEAAARGIAPESASEVAHRWATSFEQSYAEAFDALRLRGKRPAMVLDVPDFALRAARLHGARAVQLILVDAMRFDLGLRVHHYLERALGDSAMLTERFLTWSALPSTTSVQLELLARGPDGLRDRTAGLDSDVSVARGRAAQTLRRIKAGTRELLKLDVVESSLCERGPALLERLDSIAAAVAEPLSNYLLQLPPRTLAMVFGDHGFVVDTDRHGTNAGRHGGASPNEVLVPAFAWLTGATH